MTTYDYRQAVLDDVKQYIEDNYSVEEIKGLISDRDAAYEKLNDEMWTADSVTGNGSGSYTFNTYKAEEYLMHNLDLLAEAVDEFGGSTDVLKDGVEACDVTIRCYLLGQAIYDALEDFANEYSEEA